MKNNFEVTTNEYLKQCDSKDIISFAHDKIFNIKQLIDIVHYSFIHSGISSIIGYIQNHSVCNSYINSNWFDRGQECEILKAGSPGWQKGKLKIKVTLEFIPYEPEVAKSPLDDIGLSEISLRLSWCAFPCVGAPTRETFGSQGRDTGTC
jgi:hypothetical protein